MRPRDILSNCGIYAGNCYLTLQIVVPHMIYGQLSCAPRISNIPLVLYSNLRVPNPFLAKGSVLLETWRQCLCIDAPGLICTSRSDIDHQVTVNLVVDCYVSVNATIVQDSRPIAVTNGSAVIAQQSREDRCSCNVRAGRVRVVPRVPCAKG